MQTPFPSLANCTGSATYHFIEICKLSNPVLFAGFKEQPERGGIIARYQFSCVLQQVVETAWERVVGVRWVGGEEGVALVFSRCGELICCDCSGRGAIVVNDCCSEQLG